MKRRGHPFAFKRGGVYYANPALQGAAQIAVACVGHDGSVVTLATLKGITGAHVRVIEGRETAQFGLDNGQQYFVSSVAEVEHLDEAGAAIAMFTESKVRG